MHKTRGLDHLPAAGECPKCRGQLCNEFKETGECPYGDNCKFLHATEEQAAKIQKERSARRQRPKYPCRYPVAVLSTHRFQHRGQPFHHQVFVLREATLLCLTNNGQCTKAS